MLFKITARNGVPHSAAIVSADVGTPKRNDPSPVTAITRRSGRASFTPSDPPSAQPSPGPVDPVRVQGRVRSRPSYTAGAFVTASSMTMSSASMTWFSALITPSGVSAPASGSGLGRSAARSRSCVTRSASRRATSGCLSAIPASSAATADSAAAPSAWTATSTGYDHSGIEALAGSGST